MKQKRSQSQSCEAWLTIGVDTFAGKTGRDHGHAEMDALHQYVDEYDTVADAVEAFQDEDTRKVFCPSRPVCINCAYVLKELEFTRASNVNGSTEWGTKRMGSTEWGCTMKVREFLKLMGVDYETAKAQK